MAKCISFKRRLILCMMSALPAMSMALPVSASESGAVSPEVSEDTDAAITVTTYYTSDTDTASQNPEAEYNYNNKKYKLKEYDDTVIKETPVTEHFITESTELNLVEENIDADEKLKKTINGSTYTLDLENVEYLKDDIRTKEVEKRVQYTSEDTIPSALEVTITDDVTQKEIIVSLNRESDAVTGTQWIAEQIPMTVYNYDADYYMLGNTRYELDVNGNLDISGKETAILNYLNYSTDDYVISSAVWNGAAYTSNGILCRNAYAVGQRKIQNIEVTYTGTVELPQTYTAKLTYSADINTSDQYTYDHMIKAVYQTDNTVRIITMSILLFLFLLMLVIILFGLAKKKKERKK